MKPTYSPDIKMAIYLIGKVYSTCKYPCIFGSGKSPFTDVCELLTALCKTKGCLVDINLKTIFKGI